MEGVEKVGTSSEDETSTSLPLRLSFSSPLSDDGNATPCELGGAFKVEKSLGRGGTGGTTSSSTTSAGVFNPAARSRSEVASDEWLLDMSLPALFRRVLLAFVGCLVEVLETDVALVAADNEAESRELVVGVLVYVVEEAELRFGVKLDR